MSDAPTTNRDCEIYRAWADAALDGDLTPEEQAELERHLAACPACRGYTADMRQIRQAAARLPRMAPGPEAWAGIAARLEQERDAGRARGWRAPLMILAVAALLVLAVASSLLLLRGPAAPSQPAPRTAGAGAPAAGSPVHAPDSDLVKSVDEELRLAEAHYDKAIAGLEQIAKAGQSSLDPQVAATLQKNLGIIDQAIQESRVALKSQPNSQLAQESLFEALRRKVALLEDTVSLINEMRKGNQAGAARVIQGFNKS